MTTCAAQASSAHSLQFEYLGRDLEAAPRIALQALPGYDLCSGCFALVEDIPIGDEKLAGVLALTVVAQPRFSSVRVEHIEVKYELAADRDKGRRCRDLRTFGGVHAVWHHVALVD